MNELQVKRIKRLGEYLVEAKLLNAAQVAVALYDQKHTGMQFGEVLVCRGWADQRTIDFFLHQQARARLQSLPLRCIDEDTFCEAELIEAE